MSSPTQPADEPIRPQIVHELPPGPLRVIVEQPGGRFGRWGRKLLLIALGISVFANIAMFGAYRAYFDDEGTIHERYHSLARAGTDKIAIIEIEGTIMDGPGSFAKKQIDRVRNDDNVKAVVLRVDSPGGTVTGSDYIYHHVQELRKKRDLPVVVSMGSLAASGGYYIAMAAGDGEKLIYAEPTTWTGSIGVIIPHYDVTGLMEKWQVQDDSVVSHPLKQMGSPTKRLPDPLREQEQKILKERVDDSFASFKDIVLKSRAELRKDKASQDEVFTGRIFTANQAKQKHLVDELGFIESAIDRAIALAKLDKEKVRVVRYEQPGGLADAIWGSSARAERFDLSALLDLTAPRAYYLCTWLPGLDLGTSR